MALLAAPVGRKLDFGVELDDALSLSETIDLLVWYEVLPHRNGRSSKNAMISHQPAQTHFPLTVPFSDYETARARTELMNAMMRTRLAACDGDRMCAFHTPDD